MSESPPIVCKRGLNPLALAVGSYGEEARLWSLLRLLVGLEISIPSDVGSLLFSVVSAASEIASGITTSPICIDSWDGSGVGSPLSERAMIDVFTVIGSGDVSRTGLLAGLPCLALEPCDWKYGVEVEVVFLIPLGPEIAGSCCDTRTRILLE